MTEGALWGQGYVTDIGYDHGYYREQSPGQLRLAALLSGVAWDVPEDGAHYLELGCGQGLVALIVAASNPSWHVTGIDFLPSHIAGARAMAREAEIDNVTFLEADLSELDPALLPEADIVTLHGLWSWVSPAVRQGIVRLLRSRLRAGGIAHVSYNALPGWQGMLAMQRLLRTAGLRQPGRSDRQAAAGFAVVRDLLAASAPALASDRRLLNWVAELPSLSPSYLSHEFMNAHWSPCWHADVAADMAEARLDWVGSATLLENFAELSMSPEQRAVYERFDDSAARELIKDTCLSRTLRHDLYVRGPRRLSVSTRDAALNATTLALAVPPSRIRLEVEVGAGKAELSPQFYGPVTQALARAPAQISALQKVPGASAARENPAEIAGLLVGTRQAVPMLHPGLPPSPEVLRLNAAIVRRFGVAEHLSRGAALASSAVGGGMVCSAADLLVAGRTGAGEAGDVEAWMDELGGGLDEDNANRLREALLRSRDEMVPLLRSAGSL